MCRFGRDCSYQHKKSEKFWEHNAFKENLQEIEKKMEEVALKVEDNELREKVKLREAVVQK